MLCGQAGLSAFPKQLDLYPETTRSNPTPKNPSLSLSAAISASGKSTYISNWGASDKAPSGNLQGGNGCTPRWKYFFWEIQGGSLEDSTVWERIRWIRRMNKKFRAILNLVISPGFFFFLIPLILHCTTVEHNIHNVYSLTHDKYLWVPWKQRYL